MTIIDISDKEGNRQKDKEMSSIRAKVEKIQLSEVEGREENEPPV